MQADNQQTTPKKQYPKTGDAQQVPGAPKKPSRRPIAMPPIVPIPFNL